MGSARRPRRVRSIQAELAFYGAAFGFLPADPLPPLPLVVS